MKKKLTKKEIALKHYDKMIEWAKAQPENDIQDKFEMMHAISENWDASSCIYCDTVNIHTGKCVLVKSKDKICNNGSNCCNSLWLKMNQSYTWKEWIEKAKKVRKYIQKYG
jgi:hypothetical protein